MNRQQVIDACDRLFPGSAISFINPAMYAIALTAIAGRCFVDEVDESDDTRIIRAALREIS